ncbi:unnamed protein product [Clonostachys rosea]|uniref:Heterokaryon incompatibility domain-containing protein n=1 Tax=Bionectria ochroleuca TaxID=29856 RepID=A0ABY6U4N7_BIOOC|nr:unnamed protein product [Clonostachys rosea]
MLLPGMPVHKSSNQAKGTLQNHYDYSPVDPSSSEFRLLELMPGLEDEKVWCILVDSALYNKPSYEAPSYLWGNQQDLRQILLGDALFSVTSNLEAALRHLLQVQKMTIVYSQSSCVIAWTGDPADNSDEAVSIIQTLGRLVTHDALDGIYWAEGESLLNRLDRVCFRMAFCHGTLFGRSSSGRTGAGYG